MIHHIDPFCFMLVVFDQTEQTYLTFAEFRRIRSYVTKTLKGKIDIEWTRPSVLEALQSTLFEYDGFGVTFLDQHDLTHLADVLYSFDDLEFTEQYVKAIKEALTNGANN